MIVCISMATENMNYDGTAQAQLSVLTTLLLSWATRRSVSAFRVMFGSQVKRSLDMWTLTILGLKKKTSKKSLSS